MRILGVDPGLTRLGVGVVDNPRAREVVLVSVTVLTTPADWDPPQRLHTIQQGVAALLDEFQPDRVVIERVFAQHNVRTVMGTAQASGLVMALAHERGIAVSHRTPSEVKAAVTGYGGAKKPQVQQMVKTILGLDEIPKPADAADALALAITEAWRGAVATSTEGESAETPAQRAWREAIRATGQNRLKG
jgi:crossover junction endodeoxyribonuclease RuvC